MNDDQLKRIQFEKFQAYLKEVLDQGYGEVNYKIIIQDKRIQFVSLTKTNTFRIEMIQ